jgi:hypothetical protein
VTRRTQSLVALTLALSVFAILVSPFAASELTTLRTPQNTRPHVVAVPLLLAAPLATWFAAFARAHQQAEAQLVVPGSEVVALTCARLC